MRNQNTPLYSLCLLGILILLGCQKDRPLLIEETVLPPIRIQAQNCLVPHSRTLRLTHPSNSFYYEDVQQYKVEWFKMGKYLTTGNQINCVDPGVYQATITFLLLDKTKSETYEFVTSSKSEW